MEVEKNPKKSRTFYECKFCDYNTSKKTDYSKHCLTRKHLTQANAIENPIKVDFFYECVECNYKTNNKKDYNKHLGTSKHLYVISNHDKLVDDAKTDTTVDPNMTTLIMELMKRQDFLQNTLVELAKNQSIANSTVTTNSNNNNNNQQFNLQFFLNETCKDAMNIEDFIKTLHVTMEDFETTGRLGYVEGITRIILNGLKQVDTTKRPIHCTDIKRETVYVKNQDAWEKENQDKEKLKSAVNQVARMNLSHLPKWQKENPASEILDTKEHGEYMKFAKAALGGMGEKEEERYVDKIMKNVMKEVTVSRGTEAT
jgi:hypothetical protein